MMPTPQHACRPLALSLALVLSLVVSGVHAASNGTFTWPSSTQQCNTYNVSIYNGVPPWTVVLAPVNGQPIYWDISAPPRYDASRSVNAEIPLQLTSGTVYTVFAYDSSGYFAGVNPVEVQTVGLGPNSDCLADVIAHTRDFTFTVAGNTQQCEDDFSLSWIDSLGIGPYNFTVLPLDTSTNPFDVALKGGPTTTGEVGWRVNMTAGTRFTIMMNNLYGYGRGGVGGIYQVAPGTTNSCITAPIYSTSAWPAGLQTTTILSAAALPTSVITSRSVRAVSSSSDAPLSAEGGTVAASSTSARSAVSSAASSAAAGAGAATSGLSTGAAAGIGAGIGTAAIAAVGGLLFWWLRRRKSNKATAPYPRQVDLGDEPRGGSGAGAVGGIEPKVEPYPSPGETPGIHQAPEMLYQPTNTTLSSPVDGQSQTGYQYPNSFVAGAAALGAGAGGYAALNRYSTDQLSPGQGTERFSVSSGQTSAVNPYFASGNANNESRQAGPLPSKAQMARQSYQPSMQSYGSAPSNGQSGAGFGGGGGLSAFSAGAMTPMSPGSVSGSSSDGGRILPALPPGASAGAASDAGQSDTKSHPGFPSGGGGGMSSNASNAGTVGHNAPALGGSALGQPIPQHQQHQQQGQQQQQQQQEQGVEFRRHQDAEMPEEVQASGVVDLPPLYQDVPQRREGQGQ